MKVKSQENIKKILCPKCHKLIECIDGKCEFCGTYVIGKHENNIIISFLIAVISLLFYFLTIDLFKGTDLFVMSVITFGLVIAGGIIGIISFSLIMKDAKNIIMNNTTIKRSQEIIKKTKGKTESKIISQTIIEENNEKIIEKYTGKVLNNPEVLCLYFKILDSVTEIKSSLIKKYKNIIWDTLFVDTEIKEEGIKTKGIYKWDYNIALNRYLTKNEIKEHNDGMKNIWTIYDEDIGLFIAMIRACDILTEFENNKELYQIYINMYQAKITDEIIVDKIYTFYTNLYSESFKKKLERTDIDTMIELAKRKKLAEKYNVDSEIIIETKEQLIDYIVSNLMDFDREGQIISIAKVLKKQTKMKTSLKFDIIKNIDEILKDAYVRITKIKEEKALEELKAERDRLLRGDL